MGLTRSDSGDPGRSGDEEKWGNVAHKNPRRRKPPTRFEKHDRGLQNSDARPAPADSESAALVNRSLCAESGQNKSCRKDRAMYRKHGLRKQMSLRFLPRCVESQHISTARRKRLPR